MSPVQQKQMYLSVFCCPLRKQRWGICLLVESLLWTFVSPELLQPKLLLWFLVSVWGDCSQMLPGGTCRFLAAALHRLSSRGNNDFWHHACLGRGGKEFTRKVMLQEPAIVVSQVRSGKSRRLMLAHSCHSDFRLHAFLRSSANGAQQEKFSMLATNWKKVCLLFLCTVLNMMLFNKFVF